MPPEANSSPWTGLYFACPGCLSRNNFLGQSHNEYTRKKKERFNAVTPLCRPEAESGGQRKGLIKPEVEWHASNNQSHLKPSRAETIPDVDEFLPPGAQADDSPIGKVRSGNQECKDDNRRKPADSRSHAFFGCAPQGNGPSKSSESINHGRQKEGG
jgi:hypothetical protein